MRPAPCCQDGVDRADERSSLARPTGLLRRLPGGLEKRPPDSSLMTHRKKKARDHLQGIAG